MSKSIEEIKAIRAEKYQPLRDLFDREEKILSADPQYWWLLTMLLLRRTQKYVASNKPNFPPEIVTYIQTYGPHISEIIKTEALKSAKIDVHHLEKKEDQKIFLEFVRHVLHLLSDSLSADEEVEHQEREIHFLSFETLCEISNRFRLTEQLVNGKVKRYFGVYSNTRETWYDYPLPNSEKVLHKGGLGRTILKILSGAENSTIEAELPPNDFDYLVLKDAEGMSDANDLGADDDGIEPVNQLNLQEIMEGRDLDINNAFVGKNGIYFSSDACEAARTGKISIISKTRGIYGSEVFFREGIRVIKNRGIMRLLKTLAEGKALSFDFLPLNRQVAVGIYWLVLAKRFSAKDDMPLFLDRLFELARQIGQLPEGATSIFDILDAMHEQYPFFNFDDKKLDSIGVARWLSKKLVKQADKKYRDQAGIPSEYILQRSVGDTVPYEVNLLGYQSAQENLDYIRGEWQYFLSRCSSRTTKYYQDLALDKSGVNINSNIEYSDDDIVEGDEVQLYENEEDD